MESGSSSFYLLRILNHIAYIIEHTARMSFAGR